MNSKQRRTDRRKSRRQRVNYPSVHPGSFISSNGIHDDGHGNLLDHNGGIIGKMSYVGEIDFLDGKAISN